MAEGRPKQVFLDYVGLNHLTWVRGVKIEGQDFSQEALFAAIESARRGEFPFSPDLLKTLKMIPSYYLRYYYHHDEVLSEIRKTGRTRAEEVVEIEAQLLRLYSDPNLAEKPSLLSRRGGADYSSAAVSLISALHSGEGEVQILGVKNCGAISEIPGMRWWRSPPGSGARALEPLPQDPSHRKSGA